MSQEALIETIWSDDSEPEIEENEGKKHVFNKRCVYCYSALDSGDRESHEKTCKIAKNSNASRVVCKSGLKKFVCDICYSTFEFLKSLVEHEKRHDPPGDYYCNYCDGRFCTDMEKEKHTEDTHKVYKCQICKNLFETSESYIDHIKVVHNGQQTEMRPCDKCGRMFSSENILQRHKDSNCGTTRRFQCEECQKWFTTKGILKTHMLTHLKEKMYVCTYCARGFHNKYQLKSHEISHTGEKPWKCNVCNAEFSWKQSLVTHSSLHTGIKPYICECCGSRFSCSSNIIAHRKKRPDSCGLPQYCTKLSKVVPRPSIYNPELLTTDLPIRIRKFQRIVKECDKEKFKVKLGSKRKITKIEKDLSDDLSIEVVPKKKRAPRKKKEQKINKSTVECKVELIENGPTGDDIGKIEPETSEQVSLNVIEPECKIEVSDNVVLKKFEPQNVDNNPEPDHDLYKFNSNIAPAVNPIIKKEFDAEDLEQFNDGFVNTNEENEIEHAEPSENFLNQLEEIFIHNIRVKEENESVFPEYVEEGVENPIGYISNDEKDNESLPDFNTDDDSDYIPGNKSENENIKIKKEKPGKKRGRYKINSPRSAPFRKKSDLIQCPTCGSSFYRKYSLKKHLKRAHQKDDEEIRCILEDIEEKGPCLDCDLCKKKFTGRSSYDKHLKLHGEDKSLIVPCRDCYKQRFFRNKEELKYHVQNDHADRKCPDCDKTFKLRSSFKEHKLRVHLKRKSSTDPSIPCIKCGKLVKKGLLRDHERSNCGQEYLYACKNCGKKFSTAGILKEHMKLHTGELTAFCQFCSKGFRNKYQCKQHEMVHTGEKPYKCTYEACTAAFAHRNNLINHFSLHTGLRRYMCSGCTERFSCISSLKAHWRTHADSCASHPENTTKAQFRISFRNGKIIQT